MSSGSKDPSSESPAVGFSRRTFVARLTAGSVSLAATRAMGKIRPSEKGLTLENEFLRLTFSRTTGSLLEVTNKLTTEVIAVRGDGFEIVAEEFKLSLAEFRLESAQKKTDELLEVAYRKQGLQVLVTYRLGLPNHFLEKSLSLISDSSYRLKSLQVSDLSLSGPAFKFIEYRYQKNVVYFARSERGGVFLGLELPFDTSSLASDGKVTLRYDPSLKVRSREVLNSEPAFLGIYERHTGESPDQPHLPLASESDAMVAMTSIVMGPPRHGLFSLACGWWCEMEHYSYQSEVQVEADMRSIDFLAECGIDGFTDNHPWSGEIEKVNSLRKGDRYVPGPMVKKLLEYAKQKNISVIFWPTMTNTDPWWKEEGKPFRSDQPDWVMFPEGQELSSVMVTGIPIKEFTKGNCIANEPFWQWLMGLQRDGMNTGYFSGWVMDGDFFGGGGIVIPVNCPSDQHDHLPGDSNYACERALSRMMAQVRRDYPGTFVGPMCRPAMDLGIWSHRYADSAFTLDEMGLTQPLPGLSDLPINVMYGDKVRKWSRDRVHYSFFPHYMDHPQVFVGPKSMDIELKFKEVDWPSEKIDYVMLSALSSSPNLLFYLPTKAGIPAEDKAEIRKWLEWGRKNIKYLQVRKDFPQPPAAGKVDGSAHIVGNEGLVFLFNPNPHSLTARFLLDSKSIALTGGTSFQVSQTYPVAETMLQVKFGAEVTWEVPAQTALVLTIGPLSS